MLRIVEVVSSSVMRAEVKSERAAARRAGGTVKPPWVLRSFSQPRTCEPAILSFWSVVVAEAASKAR